VALLIRIADYLHNDHWINTIIGLYQECFTLVILGGIGLILYRTVKSRKLRYSFIYNFAGTINLLIGSIMLIARSTFNTNYVASACFATGLYIYYDIYWAKN
jgi:hypothetical protein